MNVDLHLNHEDAHQSRLDSWLFCGSCRQYVKKKEVDTVRFAQERH